VSAGLSLRALAKDLGVSHVAVGKAVKSGRLKACVRVVDGRPEITDLEIARREWRENASRPQAHRMDAPPPADDGQAADDDDEEPAAVASLAAAQLQLTVERTKKLQLERDVAEGRLVPVATVAKEAFEAERTIREAILNLPARLSGELAAETDPKRVHATLDAALRECLTSTAAALLEAVHG
jgi:hypothetical protein